jgi:hypothetical protein
MEHLVRLMIDQFAEAKQLFKIQLCWHCHKGRTSSCTLRNCARCGIAKYCSEACQKNHWLHHKEECADLREKPQRREEEEEAPDADWIDIAISTDTLAFR